MASALRRSANHFLKRRILPVAYRGNSSDANILKSNLKDIKVPNLTIDEYVWQNLDRWPDKTSTVCAFTGHGYTYAQTHRMSVCFAASLRTKLKLQDGDKVAVILPNIPEYPCTALGIIEAGCVPATMNPAYTAVDLKPLFEIAECKAVVTTKLSYPNVKAALIEMQQNIPVILVDNENLPEGTIKFAEFAEDFAIDTNCLKTVKRSPKDIGILPYSSGTTGLPKAVALTHNSIIALHEMMFDPSAVSVPETTDSHQSVIPAVLPFFHIFGLNIVMLNLMSRGVKLVTLPSFKPEVFLETIVKYRVRDLYVVPPIAMFLAKHPAVTPAHMESVREVISGAAALPAADAETIVSKNNKIQIRQGYGMTETSGAISVLLRGQPNNHASVGSVFGSCRIRVVDPNTGENVGVGKEGELWLSGPNIMQGYYRNQQATDEVMDNGWFKSGDIGKYDENGLVYLTDRIKELIKVKGFQVAPAELEAILLTHPAVADCAIMGIPDAMSGEVPKAFVVTKPGKSLADEEVMQYVNTKVISYKNIKKVQFIDTIPKSPAGKILKKELKKYC
ncbi:4-coumarate--CoA ligase 1-like [Aricia agestis]|uniref:4-coumarate--CoA ligase 1-like n=1 Tax=Aricia agestis TaxID=91739 RepID=UPI001C209D2E|nr:4-coumarate--CoA ligase 1-like [Aricia agestis]XP_041981332.1 4-coumarate--CoA ligase 1-like [Aricia agestis]